MVIQVVRPNRNTISCIYRLPLCSFLCLFLTFAGTVYSAFTFEGLIFIPKHLFSTANPRDENVGLQLTNRVGLHRANPLNANVRLTIICPTSENTIETTGGSPNPSPTTIAGLRVVVVSPNNQVRYLANARVDFAHLAQEISHLENTVGITTNEWNDNNAAEAGLANTDCFVIQIKKTRQEEWKIMVDERKRVNLPLPGKKDLEKWKKTFIESGDDPNWEVFLKRLQRRKSQKKKYQRRKLL